MRDFKTYLKVERKAAPASVNLALASADHIYRFLNLGPANVRRERLPQAAPKALDPEEQTQLLRALQQRGSKRDSAIGYLLLYTGIRISELHALTIDDVPVSTRKGQVIVRSGKGDAYREVPFNADTRNAVTAWLIERSKLPNAADEARLFLTRTGTPLSERAIDRVVRLIGDQAGLHLSAHILRHTFCTNLVRNHTDLILVAELAGHANLETIRRYTLPNANDRQEAINAISIEY